MRIDICIPAHNEAQIIEGSVAAVQAALSRFSDAHIIVVDNASTDATAGRAAVTGAQVLSISIKGKGAAVVAAAAQSSADMFGFIDADLSADPADIAGLVELILRGECDIAIGSRLMDTRIVARTFLRTLSSRIFNLLRYLLIGVKVHDTQCGLKLMNRKGTAVLAACSETGWFFDMEFLARAEKQGLRIKEVPVHWDEHRFPERQSKLRMLRDGFGAVAAMLRIRRAR